MRKKIWFKKSIKHLSTAKPGIANYYVKNTYNEISNYNKRKINYLEDKLRSTTQYNTDFLKQDPNKTFQSRQNVFKQKLKNYEYAHDENLKSIIQEGMMKNQEGVRER